MLETRYCTNVNRSSRKYSQQKTCYRDQKCCVAVNHYLGFPLYRYQVQLSFNCMCLVLGSKGLAGNLSAPMAWLPYRWATRSSLLELVLKTSRSVELHNCNICVGATTAGAAGTIQSFHTNLLDFRWLWISTHVNGDINNLLLIYKQSPGDPSNWRHCYNTTLVIVKSRYIYVYS